MDCCLTSPPYFGLRDYGTGQWEGGSDSGCDHQAPPLGGIGRETISGGKNNQHTTRHVQYRSACRKCGARRVDNQVGLEQTPVDYVARLVEVFREVRRVLQPTGCLWLNLGDSYAGSWGNQGRKEGRGSQRPVNGPMLQPVHDGRYPAIAHNTGKVLEGSGLKSKDLIGMPWRVAFALQGEGWYLRSALPWVKLNAMPESVKDRPASALEYVFLLTPGPRYYFDMEAVRKSAAPQSIARIKQESFRDQKGGVKDYRNGVNPNRSMRKTLENFADNPGRNFRNGDLWFQSITAPHGLCGVGDELVGLDVTTRPFKGAHFAVMPERLVEPLLLAGCPEGGLTLDPFCGAGTTGVVAVRQGCRFVGIDLNETYLRLARKRLASVLGKR